VLDSFHSYYNIIRSQVGSSCEWIHVRLSLRFALLAPVEVVSVAPTFPFLFPPAGAGAVLGLLPARLDEAEVAEVRLFLFGTFSSSSETLCSNEQEDPIHTAQLQHHS
jgi:hypothetical protein